MKSAAEEPKPTTEPELALSPELSEIFFTRGDVLRMLGDKEKKLHPDTLDRWRRRGIGPPQTVLPGRRIVFSKISFFEWMREREQQPKRVRRRP